MRLPLILLPACALALTSLEHSSEGSSEEVGIVTAQNRKPLIQSAQGIEAIREKVRNYTMNLVNARNISRNHGRVKRQMAQNSKPWTDNTVNYYFDASINDRKKKSVKAAVADLQARTCLNFVESSTAPNRVKIYSGQGCTSDSGMVGGEQKMSLGDGCESVGAVAQQFAHILGVAPTEQRPDRDTYLTVSPASANNHQKAAVSQDFPYEYGSVLHSPAAGDNGQVELTPKDARYLRTLGSEMVSFYDIQAINKQYKCQASSKCKNGGVPHARDDTKCECPAGFGGNFCDQKSDNCGQTVAATAQWQTLKLVIGEATYMRPVFSRCTYWITAPVGKKIVAKLTQLDNTNCDYGCVHNGIEIKGDADVRMTNPRYCCTSAIGTIINSELNPTPILVYSRWSWSNYFVDYKFV